MRTHNVKKVNKIMGIKPQKELQEYLEFLKIVEKRLTNHNQILTKNKQEVLKIIYENNSHLSAEDIVSISKQNIGQRLKSTTVYRSLSVFETLGIVETITVDDKKRYELSYFKQPHYHLYCQECGTISEFEDKNIHQLFLAQLNQKEFKATNFNVIINGVCNKCTK